jgi:dGTPase
MSGSMTWSRLLCKERLRDGGVGEVDDGRTQFDQDIDKVTFAGAFRRLGRKTQVHPLSLNDHVHTRLTHSLEVGQVGRALGKRLEKRLRAEGKLIESDAEPGDLCAILRAACLAHDIGNPPFGHVGEVAISQWFELKGRKLLSVSSPEFDDLKNFDGNAQGFRILAQTENHLFDGGLRATFATLGTFLKYPWLATKTPPGHLGKFSVYASELEILRMVAEKCGLLATDENVWARHPLAYLVEAADDICYAIIDLEDAVELKMMSYEDVEKILLPALDSTCAVGVKEHLGKTHSDRANLARLRGEVFGVLVKAAIDGFMAGYDQIMMGAGPRSVWETLHNDHRWNVIDAAKKAANVDIFPLKAETELGSYRTFECLLESFCSAAVQISLHLDCAKSLDRRSRLVMNVLRGYAPAKERLPPGGKWTPYQSIRRAVDFVSGMTDNYAVHVAKQIQGIAFAGRP